MSIFLLAPSAATPCASSACSSISTIGSHCRVDIFLVFLPAVVSADADDDHAIGGSPARDPVRRARTRTLCNPTNTPNTTKARETRLSKPSLRRCASGDTPIVLRFAMRSCSC